MKPKIITIDLPKKERYGQSVAHHKFVGSPSALSERRNLFQIRTDFGLVKKAANVCIKGLNADIIPRQNFNTLKEPMFDNNLFGRCCRNVNLLPETKCGSSTPVQRNSQRTNNFNTQKRRSIQDNRVKPLGWCTGTYFTKPSIPNYPESTSAKKGTKMIAWGQIGSPLERLMTLPSPANVPKKSHVMHFMSEPKLFNERFRIMLKTQDNSGSPSNTPKKQQFLSTLRSISPIKAKNEAKKVDSNQVQEPENNISEDLSFAKILETLSST